MRQLHLWRFVTSVQVRGRFEQESEGQEEERDEEQSIDSESADGAVDLGSMSATFARSGSIR